MTWDMARLRQRTHRPAYKPVGPVGDASLRATDADNFSFRNDIACDDCGYHVCSCDRLRGQYTDGCVYPEAPEPIYAPEVPEAVRERDRMIINGMPSGLNSVVRGERDYPMAKPAANQPVMLTDAPLPRTMVGRAAVAEKLLQEAPEARAAVLELLTTGKLDDVRVMSIDPGVGDSTTIAWWGWTENGLVRL